jgi:hypothetical protein
VTVEVADSGDGVPADFVPHLFDRFSRAPATTGTLGRVLVGAVHGCQAALDVVDASVAEFGVDRFGVCRCATTSSRSSIALASTACVSACQRSEQSASNKGEGVFQSFPRGVRVAEAEKCPAEGVQGLGVVVALAGVLEVPHSFWQGLGRPGVVAVLVEQPSAVQRE